MQNRESGDVESPDRLFLYFPVLEPEANHHLHGAHSLRAGRRSEAGRSRREPRRIDRAIGERL